MAAETTLPEIQIPSKRSILMATGLALGAALVILLVAVLPAEYGIDPLRTGRMLGLMDISRAGESPAPVGSRAIPTASGIYVAEPHTYRTDSEDLGLGPGEGVEIKYHMQKGAAMVYAWQADGKVQFEFHGEPDQKPRPGYFESYQLDNKAGQDQSFGSFTAPTTGIHGWFWQNKGKKEVKIHLTTAGFYDSAKMFADGTGEDLVVEDAK
jgi:hypothetical protein